jgi:hypothetical protein
MMTIEHSPVYGVQVPSGLVHPSREVGEEVVTRHDLAEA